MAYLKRFLEFDLSGLPYAKINADFLDSLGKVLRFEGLLSYIALPRLIVEEEEGLGIAKPNAGGTRGENTDRDKVTKT